MNIDEVMSRLESLSDPDAVAGMARYGIKPERALGISIPKLRKLAGELRGDHALALELWASGVHRLRLLGPGTRRASWRGWSTTRPLSASGRWRNGPPTSTPGTCATRSA